MSSLFKGKIRDGLQWNALRCHKGKFHGVQLKTDGNYSGCQVHGSGFTVDRLALFIFFAIINKSTNGSMCSSGLPINIFEFAGRYVSFIHGDVKFTLDFRARSLSISQEPDELRIRLGIETSGNIMHRWSGSILYLFLQPVVPYKSWFLCQMIHFPSQFTPACATADRCQLPGLNTFKAFNFHNSLTLNPWPIA